MGAAGGALWCIRRRGRLRHGALMQASRGAWPVHGTGVVSGTSASRGRSGAVGHRAATTAAVATSARERPPARRYGGPSYKFVSSADAVEDDSQASMPPMSIDGGSQEEFEHFWEANANPQYFEGGWVERCAHPQVNIEHYWFNEQTGQVAWQRPAVEKIDKAQEELEELTGQGPAWEMSVPDLQNALACGQTEKFGLTYEDLARRAVFEYEQFVPRVLSWHDFQHLTFWYFAGMARKKTPRDKKASFFGKGSSTAMMFAPKAFFREAAKLIEKRLGRMHPIPLTYFMWTFTRAGVVLPDLMEAVGNHLCDGRAPMMDRCSLGTMVWNFGKQKVPHDRFFEVAATEFSRPNRVRSMAPRNFQNTFLAYGWNRHFNERLYNNLLNGMLRIMDEHDPPSPKLDRKLLFAYTCKDGSEVLADSLRISSLETMCRSLANMGISGPAMEASLPSMADYTRRSMARSPPLMRDRGDVCRFLTELVRCAGNQPDVDVAGLLTDFDISAICKNALPRDQQNLKRELRNAGVQVEL